MDCEICGQSGARNQIEMDGNSLVVCANCQSLGTPKKAVPSRQNAFSSKSFSNSSSSFDEFELVEGFGGKIKNAREKKGLTMQELALHLKEHESFLQKIEQGKTLPDKQLAKRIENFLQIKLLE